MNTYGYFIMKEESWITLLTFYFNLIGFYTSKIRKGGQKCYFLGNTGEILSPHGVKISCGLRQIFVAFCSLESNHITE